MATITYLTTVEFGAGVLAGLPEQLDAVAVDRPQIVSDRRLEQTGLVGRIAELCPAGAPVFLDVPTNPTEAAAKAALRVYRSEGCDGLVAVGGGSPIDLAKGVALLATAGDREFDARGVELECSGEAPTICVAERGTP